MSGERLDDKYQVYGASSSQPISERAATLKALAFTQNYEVIGAERLAVRACELIDSVNQRDAFPNFTPFGNSPHNTAQSRFSYEVGERKKNRELIEWLRVELARVDSSRELGLSQLIEYKQQLFTGYFNLLIRDISKGCHERGQCLQMVWDLLGKLMSKLVASLMGQIRTNEQVNLTEQKELHRSYQLMMDSLTTECNRQRQELQNKQLFIDNLVYNLRFKRRELRKLYAGMFAITEKVNEFRQDYIDLQNQHIELQMFVKDIGRESAEMLVERRRLINQQRNKRIKMNQSKRRNRKQIQGKLAKQNVDEVKKLKDNLEKVYHAQKKERGIKFLMDSEFDYFRGRFPEDMLEEAPFVIDGSAFGFVDQGVSAREIELPRVRNAFVETNFIERHRIDQLKSRGVQVVDSELLSLCYLNVGCQTRSQYAFALQVIDQVVHPLIFYRNDQVLRDIQTRKVVKKSKDRINKQNAPEERKAATPKSKPRAQQKQLRKIPSQNERTFERKMRARRPSNPNKNSEHEDSAMDGFENFEEIRVAQKRIEPNSAPRAPEHKTDTKTPSTEQTPIKFKDKRGSFANFKNSEFRRVSVVTASNHGMLARSSDTRRNGHVGKEDASMVTKVLSNWMTEETKKEEQLSEQSISLMDITERSCELAPGVQGGQNQTPQQNVAEPINGTSSSATPTPITSTTATNTISRIKLIPSREKHGRSSQRKAFRLSQEKPEPVESFKSRLMRHSHIPSALLEDGKSDSVEVTVERCLMIVREMNKEELGDETERPPPSAEQSTIVEQALREAEKLSSVAYIEKVLYSSLVRTISEVYQLADSRLSNRESLSSVWELTLDSLMLGYGNIRNCNLTGKLTHLLSYVYRFRDKYAVFGLFALLNGLLKELPCNPIIGVTDFELCIKLLSGLNCVPGTVINADSMFTSRKKIETSCASILRGYLGRSHTDEVMARLYRLILEVRSDDRVCLNRTVHFILLQVLELRLNYHCEYTSFLRFLGEQHFAQKQVVTLDNFEFLLRCMQLRKTTLVEVAHRFGERSDSQFSGSKCMTLGSFCSFALLHDFPTFKQLHSTASQQLQSRWQSLTDASQFFTGSSTELLLTELRSIEEELQACHKYGTTERRLLQVMADCFQQRRSEHAELVGICYELLHFEVLDGQSHRMLMLLLGGTLEELYSLSIRLSIQE